MLFYPAPIDHKELNCNLLSAWFVGEELSSCWPQQGVEAEQYKMCFLTLLLFIMFHTPNPFDCKFIFYCLFYVCMLLKSLLFSMFIFICILVYRLYIYVYLFYMIVVPCVNFNNSFCVGKLSLWTSGTNLFNIGI